MRHFILKSRGWVCGMSDLAFRVTGCYQGLLSGTHLTGYDTDVEREASEPQEVERLWGALRHHLRDRCLMDPDNQQLLNQIGRHGTLTVGIWCASCWIKPANQLLNQYHHFFRLRVYHEIVLQKCAVSRTSATRTATRRSRFNPHVSLRE